MDTVARAEAAQKLFDAYASRKPIEPLIKSYPDMTVTDSYEIQRLQIRRRVDAGARIRGHKVGLTSAAMRRQLGVNQPDFGVLLDEMFCAENTEIDLTRFLQPRIEPEVAFVLAKPLRGPGVTVADAAAAVDFVLPAFEIIDSRIADWKIGFLDTVADNASSGALVLGSDPVELSATDLRLSGCVLHRNGRVVGSGAGGAVLGSPLNSLAWLANTVGPLGVTLEAGHVVLPGSITASIPVSGGDTFSAVFAGIGRVAAAFTVGRPTELGEGASDE
jgi:2-keto-4-pentenoate hydratase